jgi:protein-disulfide isomerase
VTTTLRLLTLGTVAVLSLAAGRPAANWNTTVAITPSGSHVLGNPAAKLKLTEFVSYTCPHCSHFEGEADAPLRLVYVRSGKVSVEVRHMLRDPIDLTAAMLTNCGTKDKFFVNHSVFMRTQSTWIRTLATATEGQRARWTSGDLATRNRAIAGDFQFYAIMATRGYDRVSIDRCLADKAMAQRLSAQAQAAVDLGVASTPSFAINGSLLTGTSDWTLLRPQIDAAL